MPVKKAPAKKTASKTTRKKTSVKKTAAKRAVKKTVTKTAAKSPVKKSAVKVVKKLTGKPSKSSGSAAAMMPSIDPLKEMEKIMTNQPFQFDQLAQDTANQSRESMEAFVKSGTIFAKGFEDIMKTAATLTQSAAEKQAEYTKQLMSSKTLNEYAEAQNKIAQANFDQFMSSATKLSEMSVKVLNEASEPLNAQMTKAMSNAGKQMAA